MIRMACASVQGVAHERLGMLCQDAFLCAVRPEGRLLLALADGAGSAQYAEQGAQIAAAAALRSLSSVCVPKGFQDRDGWKNALYGALVSAREAVLAEACRAGVSEREYASTLLLLAVEAQGAALAQIGDGAAVVRDAQGDLHALCAPMQGEYLNETLFLTTPDALETAHFSTFAAPITHIAAFSDGLQRLALQMPEAIPHPPFFTPLFQFVAHAENQTEANAQLENFLRSPRLRERADDDLTLLLASLR